MRLVWLGLWMVATWLVSLGSGGAQEGDRLLPLLRPDDDDALDAVTCASVFNSDKGRFVTDDDVRKAYAEPFVEPSGSDIMRPLGAGSIYPPRKTGRTVSTRLGPKSTSREITTTSSTR